MELRTDPFAHSLRQVYLDNNFVAEDVTGSDGSYAIYEVAGSYKLLFDSDLHIPELHNNLYCPAFKYRLGPDSCMDASNFTVAELAPGSSVQVNVEAHDNIICPAGSKVWCEIQMFPAKIQIRALKVDQIAQQFSRRPDMNSCSILWVFWKYSV